MSDNDPIEAKAIEEHDAVEGKSELAVPSNVLPTTLHLLPLFDRPFFPAQSFPIIMDEVPWLKSIEEIGEIPHHMAGLVLVKGDRLEDISTDDF